MYIIMQTTCTTVTVHKIEVEMQNVTITVLKPSLLTYQAL